MKRIILTASMMIGLPLIADSVLWHFGGLDGVEAPASITDTSGTWTLSRTLNGSGTFTDQMSQSDSVGTHDWWMSSGDIETAAGASGSIQMYRYKLENDVPTTRHSVRYTLENSNSTKSLFPTNSSGDLLPFTLEIVFKAQPHDTSTGDQSSKGFSLAALTRQYGSNSGNAVFKINAISSGDMYLQCESRDSGNGNVCSQNCISESAFRDGKWHHLALAYSIDTEKTPHQGRARVYLDGALKKDYEFISDASVRSLKYTESNVVQERAAFFSIGGVSNSGVGLSIDEVRLTDSVLAPEDFMSCGYLEGVKDRASGTVVRWTFDTLDGSGTAVGAQYGAVSAADGNPIYAMRGATRTSVGWGVWEAHFEASGEHPPIFTNDIPAAIVWDQEVGRIVNPENATSVFFHHPSEQGASSQSSAGGSSLHTQVGSLYGMNRFPSNFTFECFVKCDKTFGDNVSGMFGMFMKNDNERHAGFGMVSGQTPRLEYNAAAADQSVSSGVNISNGRGWHHLAANVDVSSGTSTVVKLWVDYVLKAEKEEASGIGMGQI